MGTGILLCGLNGAGKSTLGLVLAKRLGIRYINNEDLYFYGPTIRVDGTRPPEENAALIIERFDLKTV